MLKLEVMSVLMPSVSPTLYPHLPPAPVEVKDVRLARTPLVSPARSFVPALVTDLLLLLAGVAATFGVAFCAHHLGGSLGRFLILAATFVVIVVAALLLHRGAKHGRPAIWVTLVCIAWGVLAALWVPGLILNTIPGAAWSEGVFTGDSLPTAMINAGLVQALICVGVLFPALLAPECVRGWARGFLTASAAGLGYGGMQAILVLNGRHLVGLNTDVSLFATTHGMWLPVLQAFATGWGGMLLGRSLVKGRRRLWLGWPLAVVLAWAGALVFGAVIRASALCRTDIASASWCSGGEPNHVVAVFAWVGSAIILICIAVTAAALGGRHARLRAAAMEGLVTDGWYTRSEAAALSRRPARRALVTWATQRGGRAQARHFVATADDLMAMRMEIEDLPDPQPTPQDPRPGLLAEQDSTLKRSLSARESLRTAVAHGPGGWTAA